MNTCVYRFGERRDMRRHVQVHHSPGAKGSGSVKCQHCGCSFTREDNLKRHMKKYTCFEITKP
ncbi:hypothetical protein DPV78_011682 [Talaromyces pinophilus]|nr:hypothetical protein DPV78_011682 [Talaromyces pinophilus]